MNIGIAKDENGMLRKIVFELILAGGRAASVKLIETSATAFSSAIAFSIGNRTRVLSARLSLRTTSAATATPGEPGSMILISRWSIPRPTKLIPVASTANSY